MVGVHYGNTGFKFPKREVTFFPRIDGKYVSLLTVHKIEDTENSF